MKLQRTSGDDEEVKGRSREGAWIEIGREPGRAGREKSVAPVRERGLKCLPRPNDTQPGPVAPVRERGLKFENLQDKKERDSRSREGAWIEIPTAAGGSAAHRSLP